jgi:hypothetical protein
MGDDLAETPDVVAVLEDELARLMDWVKAAESRLAVVLPISTAMLGALAVLAPKANAWTVPAAIAGSVAAALLALGILCSALTAFPRTAGPKGSLIYFGCIVDKDLAAYQNAMRQLSSDEYFDDLTKQCHRNAQIAQTKFKWVKRSMGCMLAGSGPWAICLFLLYGGRS